MATRETACGPTRHANGWHFAGSADARVIRTGIDAFQGNSSSPLLNWQGRALGMHVNALSNESIVGKDATRSPLLLDEGQAVSIAGRLTPVVAALRALGVDIPD